MHKPHVKDRLAAHSRLHERLFLCFSVSIKQRQHWHRWATAFQCKFTQWQLTDIKINIREEHRRGEERRGEAGLHSQLLHVARKSSKKRTVSNNRTKLEAPNEPWQMSTEKLESAAVDIFQGTIAQGREVENKWKCPAHCLVRETAAWQPNSVSRSSQVIPCPSVGLPFVLYTFLCCLNLTSALSTCPIWF